MTSHKRFSKQKTIKNVIRYLKPNCEDLKICNFQEKLFREKPNCRLLAAILSSLFIRRKKTETKNRKGSEKDSCPAPLSALQGPSSHLFGASSPFGLSVRLSTPSHLHCRLVFASGALNPGCVFESRRKSYVKTLWGWIIVQKWGWKCWKRG